MGGGGLGWGEETTQNNMCNVSRLMHQLGDTDMTGPAKLPAKPYGEQY